MATATRPSGSARGSSPGPRSGTARRIRQRERDPRAIRPGLNHEGQRILRRPPHLGQQRAMLRHRHARPRRGREGMDIQFHPPPPLRQRQVQHRVLPDGPDAPGLGQRPAGGEQRVRFAGHHRSRALRRQTRAERVAPHVAPQRFGQQRLIRVGLIERPGPSSAAPDGTAQAASASRSTSPARPHHVTCAMLSSTKTKGVIRRVQHARRAGQ